MRKQGELALPGEELAVIEEFMPGDGTYEDEGKIRSAITGKIFYDMLNRKSNVIVVKKSPLINLRKAKYMIGVVDSITGENARVSVYAVEEKNVGDSISAILHVSQIANKRISSISSYLKPGDIIRAKPITSRIPISLTTKPNDCGVILAKCSICGTLMTREDEEHLRCPYCNNIETRKIGLYAVKKNGRKTSQKE
ncbi:exosome complex RNA-binding protein Csl4 [Sulfuracidifex tepidarius]|uniref:Exosome complex component Csl4 n=1 Tax=Sulfuracidifex tepidarius TaxID=1294262 RepID=A0A510DW90_9CREN|nr:exosome complex RNA-binding protein Csl4 [Sulfuracidifex tepidarius]BBG24238.1 Exosome complex component Csl4 [Sulfuracidifex tepidarius]BBG26995.1 Exosome complex component Csl4 [Sulfuracidifex tepidarius]